MNYQVDQVQPNVAEQLCREITIDLPEWFGLPECNEYYVNGVKEHINFAVKVNKRYVGLLCLEFPYPRNGSIFWIGILRQYHGQGFGYALMREAIRYAVAQSALTITVETLSPDERDANYLNTYRFYERQGFQPLFNLKPAGYQWNMVYMSLILDNKIQENKLKPFHPFLRPASIKDYPTIQNMARFYVYDMSRYCGFISDDWACPKDGLYESFDFKIYFEDPTRKAFLVLVEKELAGFVLLNQIGISSTTQWNMGEFFILAKFQGKGVAAQIAEELWKTHPGQWEVSVIPENVLALKFWCKTIANFTNNNYSKELKSVSYHPEHPSRYILTFNSRSTD